MGIEKLERVMWRLRSRNKGKSKVSNDELHKCVIFECGYTEATLWRVRKALIMIGWLKRHGTRSVIITDKDLTQS